jgi:hypothetical protein
MKIWQKPQLIVLVRNRPEEAILDFCKGASSGADSQSAYMACYGSSPSMLLICGKCFGDSES